MNAPPNLGDLKPPSRGDGTPCEVEKAPKLNMGKKANKFQTWKQLERTLRAGHRLQLICIVNLICKNKIWRKIERKR